MGQKVSQHLRDRVGEISERWVARVTHELAPLRALSHSAVLDHLPELVDGLGHYIDGDIASAQRGFAALTQGHAIQRLGYGIDLETLTREYALLRTVMLEIAGDADLGELRRLNEGLDLAVIGAIHRYVAERDLVHDRFVSILAHDLRNPLHAVTIAADALAHATDPLAVKAGAVIADSAARMGRMVRDVIDFARARLGPGIPVALVESDLGDLAQRAMTELAIAHPQRKLAFTRTGDVSGHFDPDRVIQALSNLIGNAIEHGGDPIEVAVEEAADRRSLITRVTNRGRALTRDERVALFDPLRPIAERAGLGLGLYIVHAIATAHAARIETTSSDELTTFTIVWPRVPRDRSPS